jgi:hypothetical protein
MHGDLCGPVTPATPGGRRYFLLLVDDLSRYMWVVVLDSKGEAADAIRRAQAAAEAECGRKLRGGVFFSQHFGLLLEQFEQHLVLLLEQLGQQHLGCFLGQQDSRILTAFRTAVSM